MRYPNDAPSGFNPSYKIGTLEQFQPDKLARSIIGYNIRYVFNPVLCVTLNGQSIDRRVFLVDVSRGVALRKALVLQTSYIIYSL